MFKWLKKLLKRNPPDLFDIAKRARRRKPSRTLSQDDRDILQRRADEYNKSAFKSKDGRIAFDIEDETEIEIIPTNDDD